MKKHYRLKIGRVLLIITLISLFIFLILPKGEKVQVLKKTLHPTPTAPQYKTHAIELTTEGFSPRSITIKKGDIVTWTNKSGKQASVNSAEFPTHKLFPELNLGTFENNSVLQAKIETLGELRYVNFFNNLQRGTILVED